MIVQAEFHSFPESAKRMTVELAQQRNCLVAALADEVFFAHISPGGNAERLASFLQSQDIPYRVSSCATRRE